MIRRIRRTIIAISEEDRHRLYQRLLEVLGDHDATVLMQHLPPVGWADVATKHDLESLEQRMDLRFARVDDRFGYLENTMEGKFDQVDDRLSEIAGVLERFQSDFRNALLAVMTMMVLLVGATLTVVKF